jgi:hypothetical protein
MMTSETSYVHSWREKYTCIIIIRKTMAVRGDSWTHDETVLLITYQKCALTVANFYVFPCVSFRG